MERKLFYSQFQIIIYCVRQTKNVPASKYYGLYGLLMSVLIGSIIVLLSICNISSNASFFTLVITHKQLFPFAPVVHLVIFSL